MAWRREKYVPRGGPAGGDGGRGGDVTFVADRHLSTLLELRYRQHLKAENGQPGGTRDKNGRAGQSLTIRVPVGTMVFFEGPATEPGEPRPWEIEGAPPPPLQPIGDLSTEGHTFVVAKGGRGGRGNIHFLSSTNRAPDRAEPGGVGETMWLRLELKLLADVGIVGYPNVGKSTLISRISRARPKIAEYPFTTLVPNLGVVRVGEGRSMVVADVPGLIDGASEGRGLGHQFLRHLERTRVLLHLVAPDPAPDREPVADLDKLEAELQRYGPAFEGRPRVVALNKVDTLADPAGQEQIDALRRALKARNIPLFSISAQTGEGVPALLEALWRRLDSVSRSDD